MYYVVFLFPPRGDIVDRVHTLKCSFVGTLQLVVGESSIACYNLKTIKRSTRFGPLGKLACTGLLGTVVPYENAACMQHIFVAAESKACWLVYLWCRSNNNLGESISLSFFFDRELGIEGWSDAHVWDQIWFDGL
jgi:hypothetical protein